MSWVKIDPQDEIICWMIPPSPPNIELIPLTAPAAPFAALLAAPAAPLAKPPAAPIPWFIKPPTVPIPGIAPCIPPKKSSIDLSPSLAKGLKLLRMRF